MHDTVTQFVQAECSLDPASTIPVKEAWQRFRSWLPAADKRRWQRQRFLLELGKRFAVGFDVEHNRAAIAGLAFLRPRMAIVDANGRLKMR
jgi:hypothetical protein